MNRAAVVMLVVAMALAGAALGLLAGVMLAHHALPLHGPWPARAELGPPPGAHPPIERVLPRLARALDLTPEQVRRLEPKLRASQLQFEAARESLRGRIDAELTPQQRVRWREMQKRHEHMMGRRGPFPGELGRGDTTADRPGAGEHGESR